MKKFFSIFLICFSAFAGIFAESEAVVKEIDLKDVPAFVDSSEIDAYHTFTLKINSNFKPKDVTIEEINALATFKLINPENQIEGPIEYIYFDGDQTAGAFYELRQKIENAKNKFVCVDISNSNYFNDGDEIFTLPKNLFAGHQNLYWLNIGFCGYNDLPENLCKDCKNLQFAIIWDYGNVAKSAFSGVNKNARLYGEYDDELPLSSIHDIEVKDFENWDYLNFTEEDLAKDQAEKNSEDEMSEEDFSALMDIFYEKAMAAVVFEEMLGNNLVEISNDNVEALLNEEEWDEADFYSVALNFVCNYLLRGEKSSLENSLNDRYESVFDLSGLKFYMSREGINQDESDAMVAVGVSGNEDAVKDVCFVSLSQNEDGNWEVYDFKSFVLLAVMMNQMMSEQY